MAPNSIQKRKALAKAAGVVAPIASKIGRWIVPSAILARLTSLPSIGVAVATEVLPYVPATFRSVATELSNTLFPKPTLGGLLISATSERAPTFVPLVAAFTALSIVEMGMVLKFFKTLFMMFKRDPSVLQAEAYKANLRKTNFSIDLPWNLVLSVLSLISLVYDRKFAPKGKIARLNRWISLTFLLSNVIKMYCVMHYSWLKSPIGSRYATKLITTTLQSDVLTSSQQRQVFVELPLVKAKPTVNHTHGKSAAERNAGSATAALAAMSLGKEPYYIQMSASDVRKNRQGARSYHWIKDLGVEARGFTFDPVNQAAVLVDVDHYIDMPNLLARFPGTYFISTFQPSVSACSEGEFSFRFLENNRVQYRVSGGAEYEHEVWDFRGDTILAEISSFTKRIVVAYHVDRKRLHDHHQLVMLTVIGRFEMPSIIPTSAVIEGSLLKRLQPVINGHVVMDVVKPTGLFRSIAICGDHTSVTLPKSQFDAAHAVASVAKVPITPAMVASNIAPSDAAGLPMDRLDPGHAAIVASYIRAGIPASPPVVYPPSECVVPVYFAKHDHDAPVPMKAFGSPLIGQCYTYATSIASDDRCIAGRIEKFTSRPTPTLSPSLAGYMSEFAERLIPVPHLGMPLELDEVQRRQDRPSQRHILDEASVSGSFFKTMIKAFIKKETAVKPSDPRCISTLTPQVKLAYSSYLYAFHGDVMSRQPWYAFRYTPTECAQRVCEVVSKAKHAVPADASRFDGHVNRNARIFERVVLLRQFDRRYHAELNELLDKQVGIPGVTTEGRKYATGDTRGSGSPETSDMNSTDSAFIGFCAWRRTINPVTGQVHTPDEAWAKLGIYGGDDSLEGEVDPEELRKAAEMFGQDYKIKIISRGEIGVEFLNRQFGPNVWNGEPDSLANPSRLLAKLWVGPAVLPHPLERFAERCSGYYRMDRNSPIIGEIVRIAHRLLGERTEGVLMPWAGRIEIDSNWPNEDSGWFIDVFNVSIPDFDFDRFRDWISLIEVVAEDDKQVAASMLLQAPLCTSTDKPHPEPSTTCVLDDQIVHVEEKVTTPVERPDPVTIVFGSLPPMVAEADQFQPTVAKTGLKPKKEQRFKAPLVQKKQTSKVVKKLQSDPRTWTMPANPRDGPEAWETYRKRMTVRWDKQEE
jgi:hypothetical protein